MSEDSLFNCDSQPEEGLRFGVVGANKPSFSLSYTVGSERSLSLTIHLTKEPETNGANAYRRSIRCDLRVSVPLSLSRERVEIIEREKVY